MRSSNVSGNQIVMGRDTVITGTPIVNWKGHPTSLLDPDNCECKLMDHTLSQDLVSIFSLISHQEGVFDDFTFVRGQL